MDRHERSVVSLVMCVCGSRETGNYMEPCHYADMLSFAAPRLASRPFLCGLGPCCDHKTCVVMSIRRVHWYATCPHCRVQQSRSPELLLLLFMVSPVFSILHQFILVFSQNLTKSMHAGFKNQHTSSKWSYMILATCPDRAGLANSAPTPQ